MKNQYMRDEMFQQIVDNCFGNIYVTDDKGKIIYINKSSAQSLGCTQNELLGMTSYDLVTRGIVAEAASVDAIARQEVVFKQVPCKLTNISLAVVSTPVFDRHGKLTMTVTYSQTESKLNDFIEALEEEKKRVRQALEYIQKKSGSAEIVAESEPMKELLIFARKVSATDMTVMLSGETGSGKEVLARYIHQHSPRKQQAFLPVNCAAIPKELMEAEFFGYEEGAFTGAKKQGKAGIFELANQGTLFLDELGELPLFLQSKLLRVLETGEVMRLGSTQLVKVNVRVVCATNKDLFKMVRQGEFREDLYYRLNVVPLRIPPLRERQADIWAMADYFLTKNNRKYGCDKYYSPGTREAFAEYHWPGNVRELKNVVERLFVSTDGNCLTTTCEILNVNSSPGSANSAVTTGARADRVTGTNASPEANFATTNGLSPAARGRQSYIKQPADYPTLKAWMDACEEEYIRQVIEECGGSINKAAKKMGVHRSGLYKKVSQWKDPTEPTD